MREPCTKNAHGTHKLHGFRAYAVNEAGPGEPTETDATTSPTAPCACGPPRLGVCTGNVLTVEWEPPKDDGGMPIVSYWVGRASIPKT
eukprot:5590194-Amphidinium_carterae.1